jgi:hypothetical protein
MHRKTALTARGDDRATIATPKRGEAERTSLHAWLPYYAGFSRDFVHDVLDELDLRSGSIVLDPMNGSGTTTAVAQERGLMAVGIELNPAMAVIARAKDASLAGRWDLQAAALAANDLAMRSSPETVSEGKWFGPGLIEALKSIRAALEEIPQPRRVPLRDGIRSLIPNEKTASGGRQRDLLMAALLLAARSVSSAEKSKNPTWLKPTGDQSEGAEGAFTTFADAASRISEDLIRAFPRRTAKRSIAVLEADAREMPLPTSSVDAVVTSPPYLTRIDYAVGTTPELMVLGYEADGKHRDLRRSIMGSTCITGGDYTRRPSWGDTCRRLLDEVEAHPSKASAGYYLKTQVQYFRDAEAILVEILRVLKPGGSAVLVVQDSWYKDLLVPLDRIYLEMAAELGAKDCRVLASEHVRAHMGLVNTRSRKYKKGKLHEHVLMFSAR